MPSAAPRPLAAPARPKAAGRPPLLVLLPLLLLLLLLPALLASSPARASYTETMLMRAARPLSTIGQGDLVASQGPSRAAILLGQQADGRFGLFTQEALDLAQWPERRLGPIFTQSQDFLPGRLPAPYQQSACLARGAEQQLALLFRQDATLGLATPSGQEQLDVGHFRVLAAQAASETDVLVLLADPQAGMLFPLRFEPEPHLSQDLAGWPVANGPALRAVPSPAGGFHVWTPQEYLYLARRPDGLVAMQARHSVASLGLAQHGDIVDVVSTRIASSGAGTEDMAMLLADMHVAVCVGGFAAGPCPGESLLKMALPVSIDPTGARFLGPLAIDTADPVNWLALIDQHALWPSLWVSHFRDGPGPGGRVFDRWERLWLPGDEVPARVRPLRVRSGPGQMAWQYAGEALLFRSMDFACDTDRSIRCAGGPTSMVPGGWACAPGRALATLPSDRGLCGACASGHYLDPGSASAPLSCSRAN
ncbi:hypothetical protein H696_01067 [Fonticula alba]|uniref:Phytase-like domain-containing protein n=1 Tax=Fonticula alba TaxID=691883 RepID=A0A058ZCI9_FONAL|nr:hypothetical protein H696_01067 [Fonticula alba]KCV71648.1 hypothetical protein H696_01067 [Fonticula alba]|eukprot:XP_009493226.1 hypothetical protein H696_01067 [Fonticula alba]